MVNLSTAPPARLGTPMGVARPPIAPNRRREAAPRPDDLVRAAYSRTRELRRGAR
jgi:hypothetical protein